MSAILRKWKQQPIDWHDLTTQAKLGHLQEHLQEEDEVTYIDKGGIACTAVAAKVTPTGALFILKDIAFDRKMYDSLDGSLLSWEGSDLRRELNTVELANLPDDLAAEITPRKITQVIAGGSITTEDKLWVPSATELFGKGHRYAACDGPDEEQLPIFKTEGDRVKDMDGETWWYWTRSPLSSSTTYFCFVHNYGNAHSNSATNASGVAFGFLIGSQI